MDRGAWQATVHGVTKSQDDFATKQQIIQDSTLHTEKHMRYLHGVFFVT